MKTYRFQTAPATIGMGPSAGWWRSYRVALSDGRSIFINASSSHDHMLYDLSSGVSSDIFAQRICALLGLDYRPCSCTVRKLGSGSASMLIEASVIEQRVDLVVSEIDPTLVSGETYALWGLAAVIAEVYVERALHEIGQEITSFRMPDAEAKEILESALVVCLRSVAREWEGSPSGDLAAAVHSAVTGDWVLRDAMSSVAADYVRAQQELIDAMA